MVTYSSYNALGVSIEASEIGAGAVIFSKLGSDLEGWELLETLNPSAVNTITTTGTIQVCAFYKVVFKEVFGSAVQEFRLRLNADAGNNYDGIYIQGAGLVEDINNTMITLCSMRPTEIPVTGEVLIEGKTQAVANGELSILNNSAGGINGAIIGLRGMWAGGNATQVTSINFSANNNFTGTIEVYGRN